MSFEIHPQILADCHLLGRLPRTHLLLHRNAQVPWFILVPETEIADLLDLARPERDALIAEAALLAQFVREHWKLSKINFAALGNVVPQLHLHVIGRSPEDACWPKPVWGNLTNPRSYTDAELDWIRAGLAALDPDHGIRLRHDP